MAEINRGSVYRNGKRLTSFTLERVVDDTETFMFSSDESGLNRLWKPRYAGALSLWGHVARTELLDVRRDKLITAVLHLSDEVSLYARSSEVEQRYWAAHQTTCNVLNRFVSENLVSDALAEDYFNSLSQDRLLAMSRHGAQAIWQNEDAA